MQDPAIARVEEDLGSATFRAGERDGRWRIVQRGFPVMLIDVAATEPNGAAAWYTFRFELDRYPGKPPSSRIWSPALGGPLPTQMRPQGCRRVATCFQAWGSDTVYRPWERMAADHNNFRTVHPHLAWNPNRTLTFALEDIHGILALNARAGRVRSAA